MNNDNNLIKNLFKIIANNAKPIIEDKKIKMDMKLLIDLGYDSISFIKMIVDIESCFEIEIENDMLIMDKLGKVSDIFNYLNKRCNKVNE
jgi:acyl carrier protein